MTPIIIAMGASDSPGSQHKVDAANGGIWAFSRMTGRSLDALKLECVQIEPGYPNQPIGLRQTRKCGAATRAWRALDACATATYGLGIENGVAGIGDGATIDLAIVALVERGSTDVTYTTSQGILVPSQYVEASLASGQTKTCGELMAEDHGCSKHDWHRAASGGYLSRQRFIKDAVYAALVMRLTNPSCS